MVVKSLERFENKYIIEGKIRMETPLRIGKQVAPYSLSSAPVLLQYDAELDAYFPFIPGSSLKGVLRSTCERIVRSFGIRICEPPNTCDRCVICGIFGSQEGASRVRVKDCRMSEESRYWRLTEERPHHTDRYDLKKGRYVNRPNPGGFRTEEYIPPLIFDLHIEAENLRDDEISLLLLGLDEFNHRRAHIGGGVSRGYGFASVDGLTLRRLLLDGFRVREETCDLREFFPLRKADDIRAGRDFRYYWRADDDTPNGCIVSELSVLCMSDFVLKGVDERSVSVGGIPVIPGSVIKGFLRKRFINHWDARKIDDVFGSQRRDGHRSRVIISDAFSEDIIPDDRIPARTKLRCWIVFDNMEERDIKDILSLLKQENTITGNVSARGYRRGGKRIFNRVKFELESAWKFTLDDFHKDVTGWFG